MALGKGIGFKNKAAIDRVIRASRYAEGLQGGVDTNYPNAQPSSGDDAPAHVQVTGPAIDGTYPGIFVYRNITSLGSVDDWLQFDDDPQCYVEEIEGGELEIGKKYPCIVVGYYEFLDEFGDPLNYDYNLYPLAIVQLRAGEAGTSTPGGDVWGPESARPGEVAAYTDPNGRFIGRSHVHIDFHRTESFNRRRLFITMDPGTAPNNFSFQTADGTDNPYFCFMNFTGLAGSFSGFGNTNPDDGNATKALYFTFRHGKNIGTDSVNWIALFDATNTMIGFSETITFASSNAVRDTMLLGGNIIQKVSGMRVWEAGWTSTGTQGIGTFGSSFLEGYFVARQPAIANLSGSDDLPTTIAKVNAILAMLRSSDLLST